MGEHPAFTMTAEFIYYPTFVPSEDEIILMKSVGRGSQRNYYPLIAPLVKPEIILSCNNMNIRMTGIMVITIVANIEA